MISDRDIADRIAETLRDRCTPAMLTEVVLTTARTDPNVFDVAVSALTIQIFIERRAGER